MVTSTILRGCCVGAVALGLFQPLGVDAAPTADRVFLGELGIGTESITSAAGEGLRYAIVVGNANYAATFDLRNAANDARVVSEFLRQQGFRVFEAQDLDKRGFEALLQRALTEIRPGSEVVFYYAGHGIQIGRRNYLLPVDAKLENPYDTPFQTITLESIISHLSARSRLNVVILDSCRNNPFGRAQMMTELNPTLFEAADGFAAVTAPLNSYIAYSTAPGQTAADGEGQNSPFTESLVNIANAAPEAVISTTFGAVRRAVHEKTGGQQTPWDTSSLVEDFSFGIPEASETANPTNLASESQGNALRGLALAAAAPTQLADIPIPTRSPLTARLERFVSLGPGLQEVLGGQVDGARIRLVGAPEGRLVRVDLEHPSLSRRSTQCR